MFEKKYDPYRKMTGIQVPTNIQQRLEASQSSPYLANVPHNEGNTITWKKSGSGTSSGGGTSGGSGGGIGGSALLAYFKELEARQQDAANKAYENNVAATNQAYADRQKLLGDNLSTTLNNLQADYNTSKANVNKDAQSSLQQAYINNMLSRKNLNQNMAAQGLSGGASETTMAGMYNNYGNARNNIQTVANDNLASLENLYNKNKNSAYQAYNDQLAQDAITKAQYMAQFESDRQNALANAYNAQMSQLMSLDPSYAAGMLNLENSQSTYTPASTSANNTPETVNTQQGGNKSETQAAARKRGLSIANLLRSGGQSDSTIAQQLSNIGLDASGIAYVLNQLNNQ